MSNTMILKDKSVQVSRIRRSSSFVMKRPHYHSYYEIYYLLSGKCKMFINQDIYYLEPGDITIIPPLEVHKALYEPSWQAERFGIYFSGDTVSSFLSHCGREAFGHIFSRPKRTIPPEFRPRIEELLAQMQDEEKQGDSYCQIQLRSLLHQILVVLGRCQETRGEGHALEETEEAMVSAARYMNQHYQEGLTLGEVAAFANMSPTYFSKKFKGSTGLCFKEYLNYIRVQKASDMLRNTDLSVTGVAMACGFSDGNYFGDVFRRLTGVSPREYRKGRLS